MVDIDIPEVHSELAAAFKRYERALLANDIETVNGLFWNSPLTVRYGTRDRECHHGHTEIAEFRIRRGAVNQARVMNNTHVTTFGRDFGITNTQYQPAGSDRNGRQSQAWVRTGEGWKIVSAHVSFGT
jgi:hypothetical protein